MSTFILQTVLNWHRSSHLHIIYSEEEFVETTRPRAEVAIRGICLQLFAPDERDREGVVEHTQIARGQ